MSDDQTFPKGTDVRWWARSGGWQFGVVVGKHKDKRYLRIRQGRIETAPIVKVMRDDLRRWEPKTPRKDAE